MFCRHCGNELPENANFCPVCGNFNQETKQANETEKKSEYFEDPAEIKLDDIFENEKKELGGSILKFAILGLAFGATGLLSLLGLIFTIISKAKVGTYKAKFGNTEGAATVGKHLGLAGMILNIFMVVFFTLYFIILFGVLLATM